MIARAGYALLLAVACAVCTSFITVPAIEAHRDRTPGEVCAGHGPAVRVERQRPGLLGLVRCADGHTRLGDVAR